MGLGLRTTNFDEGWSSGKRGGMTQGGRCTVVVRLAVVGIVPNGLVGGWGCFSFK